MKIIPLTKGYVALVDDSDFDRVSQYSWQAMVPRRGFALRDAIHKSQGHGGTALAHALNRAKATWKNIDRIIVITDEQSQDGTLAPWLDKSYVVNVAAYKNGVSYRNGWHHIDGWSERCIDYIREFEIESARQEA